MSNQHIKDSQSYHFAPTKSKKDGSTPTAVFIALGVHVVLIFGITFGSGINPADKMQDVAEALTENLKEDEEAHFIANATQVGSGEVAVEVRLQTTQISPVTAQQVETTQDILNQEKKVRQQQYHDSYLRTTLSWRDIETSDDNKEDKEQQDLIDQEAKLREEIATLEAQLSQRQRVFAQKTKVETVDSNSTTQGEATQYLERFRQHVENVGNATYPRQARVQGIEGDVMLMVIIQADGTIKAIRLLESSGSKMLDEAAKQSARQAAPFGKFGSDMKDIVELRVIRTWHYGNDVQVTY